MTTRTSLERWGWTALLLASGLLGGTATTWAQLTETDIAALRERGEREGWTFTVGESEATSRPLDQLCGLVMPPDWRQRAHWDPCPPQRALPAAWDWRTMANLPVVRDQGGCGSCWAFAAIGAMECALAREAQISTNLSEQWLVSCTWAGSCGGGWYDEAFEYLKCGGQQDPCGGSGAILESSFPYVAWDAPCGCPYAHPHCLDSWMQVGTGSGAPTVEQIKQAIYDHGPVAVGVYVNDAFAAYHGGIFNACESFLTNHAVVLVGWDDNQGGGVWILRNSWGASWGESGYMRIAYDCCRVGYATAYVNYRPPDCNKNGVADREDIAAGTSLDCNGNTIPDECEPGGATDCDGNGVTDLCDVFTGTSVDCNGNGRPDACEIADGTAADCNVNGVPDTCELNAAYRLDDGSLDTAWGTDEPDFIWLNPFTVKPGGETLNAIEIAWGFVPANAPATLAVWSDPNGDGDPHDAHLLWKSSTPVLIQNPLTDIFQSVLVPDVLVGQPGDLFFVGAYTPLSDPYYRFPAAADASVTRGGCWVIEANDLEDLSGGAFYAIDEYGGGVFLIRARCVPPDCNANGVLDSCDVAGGTSADVNNNQRPDECDPDCNTNGLPDDFDIAQATSQDCNESGVPDECETDLGVAITTEPVAVTVCEGESATLAVGASGAGTLAYQWRRYHVPIAGATQSTLTLPAVTPDDAGTYDVVVSSTCTSPLYPAVPSMGATLTVERAAILASPENQTVLVGDTTTLSVSAVSSQALTYQWRKDGTPITGAVLSAYTIVAATLADAGVYDVLVGGCGMVASAPATVTVVLARAESPLPANGASAVPVEVTLSWNAVPGADEYDVYLGTSARLALQGTTRSVAWSPGPLAYDTKYFWQVTARSGGASTEGVVWWFVTEREPVPLPGAPAAPLPPDGAVDVPRDVELTWQQAPGAALYKVLVGQDPALADGQLRGSTESCCCVLASLQPGAAYYWQVIAKNAGGYTAGPIWSFVTEPKAPAAPHSGGLSPSEPNAPSNTGDNAPADANSPSDSGLVAPEGGAALCPATSSALLLVTGLGLRGAHGRQSGGKSR
jgi:hypothetical protein